MKDLAPHITRQRLIIEGFYSTLVDRESITKYLHGVAKHLNLRTYGDPTIHSPEGMGKDDNQGFDAFIPLIDSGISLYVWSSEKFMSVIIYTCKSFSSKDAIEYTKKFYEIEGEIVSDSF